MRFRKYGDPLGRSERFAPARERILRSLVREGECWVWALGRNDAGYGMFHVDGIPTGVHRLMWVMFVGPIPPGMEVDHECHNPACAAPHHLRLATRSQNAQNRSGAVTGSATGIRGVSPTRSGFIAYAGGRRKHFKNIDDAAAFAACARRELYGEFAGKE